MARIQVLPLPTAAVGPVSAVPFALVIDEASDLELDQDAAAYLGEVAEKIGARGVFVCDKRLDVVR